MKKLTLALFLLIILFSTIAYGTTLTFTDNKNYWPGWGNGTSDDSQDSIGIPQFTGGTITLDGNGKLQSIAIGQSVTSPSSWSDLSPGDLFIDTNADGTWDYVVNLTNWTAPSANPSQNPDPIAGGYNLFAINMPLGDKNNNPGYILSGTDNTNGWSGYLIRDHHPVAYGLTLPPTPYGVVQFSGWDNNSPLQTYTFDFSGLGGLPLGQYSTIAWTTNCANDVIYETFDSPVPEPATMFLLGAGLIGLAGYGRKKFKK